ncbi:uncharacterized protein LOC110114912 [Dendrobium catenatum]|uniref:uncharacterized protein LOC110114912 n=1 Tax=Dendrobium catenatum TaxID=906689 RepID=UPI0009F4B45B|nr:uncharacterized protein LOC110114912 [Dendrobium catenatum]
MISNRTFSGSSAGTLGHSRQLAFNSGRGASSFRLSFFSRKTFMNSLSHRFSRDAFSRDEKGSEVEKRRKVQRSSSNEDDPRREEKGLSGIYVPRQKYISVSKAELLQAILEMFELKEDADNFLKLSVCLDSILHAEHKGILEEMRSYYSPHLQDQIQRTNFSIQSWEATSGLPHVASNDSMGVRGKKTNFPGNGEDEKPVDNSDLGRFFESLSGKGDRKPSMDSQRIAVAIRFQQSFMKLLHNAQFEELSAQDLLLTNALNSDYLLTLPIYVDWKRASESHAIIFRRGYATERQRGLLIAEKFDYLQSKLLQEIFFNLSRPLKQFGKWLYETLKGFNKAQSVTARIDAAKLWLKDQYSLERTWSYGQYFLRNQLRSDIMGDSDLPIWLAAQRAVPRYEGFLSVVGPRRRLMKKLLTWVGLVPSMPEVSVDFDRDTHSSETDSRPNFLQRITLSNLWEPASKESCGNNVWKILSTAVSILFSRSILQEPAFEELILLYTDERNQREDTDDALRLHLKIYERIPIPDLPVIFPHKKLSFRILDTVRLDVASILGLLAFFLNYKFENILSSPSAVLLDVIGTTALIVYVSRVVLGYKQTWDRYQLLVNKTLYEKTLASGFGSVHFLLDASELQQYKEAILLYAILLHPEKYEVFNRKSIGAECEMFLFDKFNLQIDMPIDEAMDTLMRLDLVSEFPVEGNLKPNAIPCSKAYEHLRKRWSSLLDLGS